MKKPKTDRFDPNQPKQKIKPEDVDLSGVPEIKTRVEPAAPSSLSESAGPSPQQKERTGERTDHSTVVRPKERTKVRHSFDVFKDQLLSLKEIQLQRERETGEKTLLGDLVQEALDLLITQERTEQRTK